MTTITPVVKAIASGLRFPEGPVAMLDGSIILVEIERRTLSRVTPDGTVRVIARLGGGPNGAAMGPGGKIYVTNNGGLKFVERPGKLFPVIQADDYVRGCVQVVDPESGAFDTRRLMPHTLHCQSYRWQLERSPGLRPLVTM